MKNNKKTAPKKVAEKKSNIKKRGFGSMSQERIKEICSMGGKASALSPNRYRFNSKTASKAGKISARKRKEKIKKLP